VNEEDFEYKEHFTDDWEQRWFRGPAKTDETGLKPCAGGRPSEESISRIC